jgi:uncharacterized membrane-anchored protein YitT (DUF2179 family)
MTLDHKLILKEIQDYVFITLGLFLYSFGFTVFLMPYEIVSGGVTGISAIIFYATGFNIEYTYLIINVGLLAVALRVLGWRFLSKTIYAIFMLSFLLGLFQSLLPRDESGHFVKILGEGQNFMSLILGCTMTGSALGIVFLNNGSTGGTDIIAASVNKFRDVSLGTVLAFLDLIIIGSCLLIPTFGDMLQRAYMVVFGLCTMVIESYMIDFLMNRQRQSVQFMIFSKKWEEIANAIATKLDHGVTILDGHGWYTGHERKVLCILAKKRESQIIFRIIKSIDPQAFVSQSAVIGVFGEGFDQIKVKGIEN